MWADINGEHKKVACCPHPTGSCGCERVVINYTIPKSSECACPSQRSQTVAAATAGNNRVQKSSRRRSTAINVASVELAMKAVQDAETDTSSYTHTPTERSGSNEASLPSSASSTPRISPNRDDSISSCCKPRPMEQPQLPARQGGCCGSKTKPIPEPVPVKSCCSSSNAPVSALRSSQPQPHFPQGFGQQFQFQLQSQVHPPQYANPQSHVSTQSSFPFSLGHPIYNHVAAAYQHPSSLPMGPATNGPTSPHISGAQNGPHAPEHNCHCGESCSCFGCAAHPNNATMMEYVRLMAQFQYTGDFGSVPPPLYDLPSYPHHPEYGAEAHQPMNFTSMSQAFPTPAPSHMGFHTGMNMSPVPNTPLAVSTSWHQTPVPAPSGPQPHFYEPSNYVAPTPSIEHPLRLKTEELPVTPIADSPNDGQDEETSTLSPTSFFWNEMVLPSCSDNTGTCQCGDGCACVGCITHGGHNGVSLDDPALTTFPGFASSTALDDPSSFLFSPAPNI
ncbi:hypothetical protein CC86DRAFT_301265 [Ophiobolus disseminans]|uniref:Copper-fist domain-containing protein n=1 Tax=Ophiobolus disseminans TaxID=1469910 RepID=A0A6A6ZN91_9PLEO|nr:hypothetical protein CC86DRAFT_301265 [Ophiobolus disseminans]